jgi:DNA-binding Lrp family transcriptional regulator
LAKDEAGRLYTYKTLEHYEAGKKAAQFERDKRHFSFGHMRNIRGITRGLSNKYCGYTLMLQPYIQFKTNVLVTEGREGSPLTLSNLARIWDVSNRTARAIVDELESRSIIFETSGVFTINERYHFRKKASGDVDALIKTFFTTLKSFNLTAADLGFVYKLLPYVHYDTNLICADPFVNPSDIRFLTDSEIGDIVGMTETKTKESLARLRKARIIGEWINVEDRRAKFTALNPYVFYRKPGEPDGMLRALFNSQRRN